jgi:uncharacterized protein (DUF1499 family)
MKSLERIEYETLVRARTPNTFLLAPEGLCRNAKPDVVASTYGVTASQLRQAFLAVALSKPRVSHALKDDQALYDNLLQKSALFGFPDLIAVRFMDLGKGRSTLAVYSRSVYGRSDLGVNRARIMAWVRELQETIKPVSP